MANIVTRCSGVLLRIETEWGKTFDPAAIHKVLKTAQVKILAVVHAETSTGVLTPLSMIREVLSDFPDTLLLVDCVTSLGGHPVRVDDHRIDFAYSGTQKCLSCPPGLAPITVSERALAALRGRKGKVQSWYLDLSMVEKYWGADRTYHHTAPISMNFALREALRLIEEEGLDKRWERHRCNHLAFVAGIEAMGLEMLVKPENRLWSLNTVRVPEGISDAKVRSSLLEEFGIEIGGGLGPLKGKIWRVGLMGYSSHRNNVLLFLNALEQVLAREGFKIKSGTAVAAAEKVSVGN